MTGGSGVASGTGVGVALQTGLLPGLPTATGTAVFGLAVAVGVWLVRFLVRRRRGRENPGVPEARALEPSNDAIALAASRGSAAADVAFSLPYPRSGASPRQIRHAELYAVELGLVAGGLVAWLASLASVDPLVGGLVGATMGGLGLWRVRSMAVETARQETALWLVATGVGLVGGWLLFL